MSRRHANICDTDLCTSDIDDNLLYTNPSTGGLSAELSEVMKDPYDLPKRSRGKRRPRNDEGKIMTDIHRLFDMIKQINRRISDLQNGNNTGDGHLDELITRLNSKANKTDIAILDGKVEELEQLINETNYPQHANRTVHDDKYRNAHNPIHLPEHNPTHLSKDRGIKPGISREINKAICIDTCNPVLDTELKKYIDCKIDEAVDPILELLNEKLEEQDKKIDAINKIMVNALKNFPVYC